MKTKSKLRAKIYRAVAGNMVVTDKDGVIDLAKTDTLRVDQILQAFSEEVDELEKEAVAFTSLTAIHSGVAGREDMHLKAIPISAIKEMKGRIKNG